MTRAESSDGKMNISVADTAEYGLKSVASVDQVDPNQHGPFSMNGHDV